VAHKLFPSKRPNELVGFDDDDDDDNDGECDNGIEFKSTTASMSSVIGSTDSSDTI
jgi:hypothetical protein